MGVADLVKREQNTKTYAAGQTIFREGDPANNMYVLDQGEVEIATGSRVIDAIQTGGFFGEMGLINHKPRSASATARVDSTIVVIEESDFYFLVQHSPYFALEVMKVLAERVRRHISA